MNFFFDTEFSEGGNASPPTIELISIGIVDESGERQFYAESSEFNIDRCNDWVKANVIPHLGPPQNRWTRAEIREQVTQFLGPDPVLWAYYASYDWVVFCWLWGAMIDLPQGFPMHPMDLQQLWIHLGKPDGMKPPKPKNQHNALADAKWNREFFANLQAVKERNLL